MRSNRRLGRMAIVVPVLAGLGLLLAGSLLLPGRREVVQAARRALPARIVASVPALMADPDPPPPTVTAPTLAAAIPTASAAELAALTAQLIAQGQSVTTAQVAYDLIAHRRPTVALAYLAARPDGDGPATWLLHVDLLAKAGRMAEARALVAQAARAKGSIPAADLTAAAYAVDRPDLLIAAAANGAIPPPDATLALDLARRADAAGRSDLIAALDRSTRADWRGADPWLALRVAARAGDRAAGLRAADRLPADQRDAAREAILTAAGDADGLHALLLARADAPGARLDTIAEQLLATGHRDDAVAVLRRAATGGATSTPVARRLLYLIGPRPEAVDVAWLKRQATEGRVDQPGWLSAYAERARPREALAVLAAHPLAARTDMLLQRATLARAAGDDAAGRSAVGQLLDGRALDGDQLRRIAAVLPDDDRAQAEALAKRRVAAGIAGPRDTLDLAWTAWNANDAAAAARWLRLYLAGKPDDPVALRLMADVQARTGGERAARPWLERALAATQPGDSRTRAELLDRLGRRAEAVAMVERLRADLPEDRTLAALHARLLIAQGRAGAARGVVVP